MVETISRHDPYDIAWVAGIIDGEGHVSLVKQSWKKETGDYLLCPVVTVANTDFALLRKYTEILYEWGVHFHYLLDSARRRKESHRPQVAVRVTRVNSVARLLEIVTDHLTAKRPYAQIVLEFCHWKQGLRLMKRPGPRKPNGQILPVRMRTDEEVAKEHEFYERLQAVKQNWVDVSETTRKGSRPIEIKGSSALHGDMQSLAEMTRPRFKAE